MSAESPFSNFPFTQRLPLPVPDEVVAILRLPVPIDALSNLIAGMKRTYGDDLVFRTDIGIDGWMFIARVSDVSETGEQQ